MTQHNEHEENENQVLNLADTLLSIVSESAHTKVNWVQSLFEMEDSKEFDKASCLMVANYDAE